MTTIACIYFEKPEDTLALAEIFYRATPQVMVRGDRALFLEISKMQNIFSEKTFLRRAFFTLKRLNIRARFGLAGDLGTALSFAYYATHNKEALPIDCLKFYLDPFGEKEDLAKDIANLIFNLKSLGVQTLGAFLKLSSRDLSSRFGKIGLMAYIQVTVPHYPPLKIFTPASVVREKYEFDLESPVENLEPIYFVMKNIIDKLILRLRGRGKRLKKFEIVLKQEHVLNEQKRFYKVGVLLQLPYVSSKVIFQITKEKIDAQVRMLPFTSRITEFEVVVLEDAPYFMTQKDIFNQKKEEASESFFQLVSRFSTKLDPHSVFFAQTKESYLPEKNWERVSEMIAAKKAVANGQPYHLPERPLRLFPEPLPIHISQNKIIANKMYEEIETYNDKEVVLADWWQSPLERVYCRLSTRSGKDLWVFKNHDGYFLHGVFD